MGQTRKHLRRSDRLEAKWVEVYSKRPVPKPHLRMFHFVRIVSEHAWRTCWFADKGLALEYARLVRRYLRFWGEDKPHCQFSSDTMATEICAGTTVTYSRGLANASQSPRRKSEERKRIVAGRIAIVHQRHGMGGTIFWLNHGFGENRKKAAVAACAA